MSARARLAAGYARWTRLGLTTRIVAGLLLGVALGLFFGERMRPLQVVADAYIGLMQMTVLPYLVVALVTGLGRLQPSEARAIARYGGIALLVVWALSLGVVALMPVVFPASESGGFFSTSVLQAHAPVSFVELYIPANPFRALSESVVPAVTLFSLSLGIALIGTPGKERFLDPLDALLVALGRITHFVVELTPWGVVFVAGVAAGTLAPEELARLSVYFVAFFLAALLLGGVLLPGAVALLTPFGYRETVSACRDAMITAFVTSNVFIVLPMLSEQCARLAAARGLDTHGARTAPAVLVPIAFNFPTAGKLLTLLFVPFGAWMHGQPLAVGEYPGLLVNGLFSYFAKAQVALPFLLDRFELPGDLFNLYIPSTLVNGKLDSAVGAMSLFALTLLTTAALAGQQRLRLPGLVRGAVVVALLLALLLPGTRALLAVFAADAGQRKAQALQSMHLARADMSQVSVLAEAGPRSPTPEAETPGIQRIRARGVIRVAYQPERLPFSFRNSEGQLVGYDVELAAQLARDLGVPLELVPTSPDRIEADLAAGVVDLVPGVRYTHHWIGRLRLSAPYMEATLGMLVRDRDREQYLDLAGLRASARRLRVAVPGQSDLYEDHVREFLAGVDYELVELESWAAIASATERFDMLVGLAEVGMAWSLLHPEYTVVVPRDHIVRRPLAFALDPRDESLARVVDEWVVLQRARGNLDSAYDYWVLGKGADQRRPRWSIVRDVLGWMD